MNWILASLLMFLSSAVMYTLIRGGQKSGITTTMNSFAMFALPVPLLFFYALATHSSLVVTPYQLFLMILSAFFLSWLGNLFSLKAIEQAPNPGYSLILSKSYVVFTATASIFLFHSPLTVRSMVGIALIVLFSAIIILSGKKAEKVVTSFQWVWLSLGAFFCWGGLALMSKYLLNLGVSVPARLFYMFFFVSLILIGEFFVRREKIHFERNQIVPLFFIGLLGMLFNLFMQYGFSTAPNPGFINAINASSIVLVTLLATVFFKDDLNRQKFIGIVGVTVGMLFLFL